MPGAHLDFWEVVEGVVSLMIPVSERNSSFGTSLDGIALEEEEVVVVAPRFASAGTVQNTDKKNVVVETLVDDVVMPCCEILGVDLNVVLVILRRAASEAVEEEAPRLNI